MCQKHLKHLIARYQRSPRSRSSGYYSFECKERNLITRVWTSYHVNVLLRAFDHICMEKARYKFLIIIILVKLTQSTELEQERFDLRSVPPAGTP